MPFNPLGFLLATTMTRDMTDRDRASQLSLLGGVLGNNPLGLVLVASAAREGPDGPGTPRPTDGRPAVAVRPDRVQVPAIEDPIEDAEKVIESRGLVPVVVPVESAEPIDRVIGTEPAADTVARRGSTVSILVSAGVTVPDVTGQRSNEAHKNLEAAGLDVARQQTDKEGRDDVVEHQDPPAGTLVDAGSTVTIHVFPSKSRQLRPARSRDFSDDA